jgi:Na+/melibiose symporter-like transporter
LDQAIFPATTSDKERTLAFAWYNILQDAGHAVGALLAGLPVLLRRWLEVEELASLRLVIAGYALLLLLTAALYSRLSPAVDAPPRAHAVPLSDSSRRALWKISALFAVDSLAGGFLTSSLLSFFFFQRFGATEGVVGLLFFGARVANAASHLGAAWLAKRFGLVKTMVFTHIPSSLFLVTVAFAPNFAVAAALFLVREGLVEMDVPTRQSYVMAMVRLWHYQPGSPGWLGSRPILRRFPDAGDIARRSSVCRRRHENFVRPASLRCLLAHQATGGTVTDVFGRLRANLV